MFNLNKILALIFNFLNKKNQEERGKMKPSFIKLYRYSDNGESTLGLLFVGGEFACYVLEDEKRDVKIKGETRIPAGTYEVKFRSEGGFHEKYKVKFKEIHRGMLHIANIPNFEYVLIHCGNTDDNTEGCLLVGNKANNNNLEDGVIESSQLAYKYIYPKIAEKLEKKKVFITIKDEEVFYV